MSEIDVIHEVLDGLRLSQERVVLVGGLAIFFYTGVEVSKDVDFAVMTEDYEKIPSIDMFGVVKHVQYQWGFVDFLNPDSYVSKQHTGNEFIDYIKRHRSFKVDGIYVAKPEVVFYTRLVISNWGDYIRKSRRDLGAGLLREKDKIYAGVKAMGDIFGTRDIVDEHLKELEEHVQSYFPTRL